MTIKNLLTIHYSDTEPKASIDAHIKNQFQKLKRFYSKIISCKVTLLWHDTQPSEVKITIEIPKHNVVINQPSPNPDYRAFTLISDAFHRAQHTLCHYNSLLHDPHTRHIPHQLGTVKKLFAEEQYGFIEDDFGEEYYFSADYVNHNNFDHLKVGQPVKFMAYRSNIGEQAHGIKVIKKKQRY